MGCSLDTLIVFHPMHARTQIFSGTRKRSAASVQRTLVGPPILSFHGESFSRAGLGASA